MLDPVPKAKLVDVLLASAVAPKDGGAAGCCVFEPKEKLGGDAAEAPKLNPP